MIRANIYAPIPDTLALSPFIEIVTDEKVEGYIPEEIIYRLAGQNTPYWAVYALTKANKSFLFSFEDLRVKRTKGEPLFLVKNCGNIRSFKLSDLKHITIYG